MKNFVALLAILWSSFLYSQELNKIALLDFKSNYKFVSLIYAYQNLDDVSSVFGHTFLVFHNNPQISAFDLSVEFSVYLKQESIVRDYLGAAVGNINGEYRYNYFYNKKREYELEGRNLFVYRLNLREEQISRLIYMIKDRKKETFPYSFFRKNCSYYIQDIVAKAGHKKFPSRLAYQPSRFVKWVIDSGVATVPPVKLNMSFTDKTCSPNVQGGCFQSIKNNEIPNIQESSLVVAPPLLESGHFSFRKNLNGKGVLLDLKESQKSFFQNSDDQFRFSSLEILRLRLDINESKIVIPNLNIIKLEDLNFHKTSKILDMSYQNELVSIDGRSLIYFDFGIGKGFEFGKFGIHFIPLVRSSIERINDLEGRVRLGGSFIASYAFRLLSFRFKTEIIGDHFNKDRKASLEANFQFSKNIYFQYEGAYLAHGNRMVQSLGVSYTF